MQSRKSDQITKKKLKLLLLQPPIEDFYDTDIRLQPIGLCYLKGTLAKYLPQIKVIIKDYHQGHGRRTIAIPKELKYLQDYYGFANSSPFSSFYHYYHFGASFEKIIGEVLAEKPDIVGISSLFSPYYREVLKIATLLKEQSDIPILLGGSHVSALPEQMLQDPSVDFVIRAEGERPLVSFLEQWLGKKDFSQVPNLGYKEEGKMVFNEIENNFSLDEIPHPDLSDLEQERYQFENRPLTFVITSRSCPHRCTFCSVHMTFGKKYRRRSPQCVVAEIQKRYEEGYRVFDFEDDNLTLYVEEMKDLCYALMAAFPQKDVQFVAMNGISYLSLDKELLGLMRQTGFTHLNLALVSSDKTVRETTKRPHTIEKYLEVVEEAHRLDFKIVSYQILGLPNESLASMIQTLIFGAGLPILLGASMFYLTPNSPIAHNMNFPPPTEEDIFKSRLTSMAIETQDFKREDIYTLFLTTRIINFLKGLSLPNEKTRLEEALSLAKNTSDHRQKVGVDLLEKLFQEKKLYAHSKQGYKELVRFHSELFFQVWAELPKIVTQEGKTIENAFELSVFPIRKAN